MPKKTLFLIDGSALAYRSFYAFINNPLTNSKGENTSAVFGFCRFLFKILDEEKPDYWAVVFDPPGPTFRHKQYKEYKATRQKMPEDMRDSIPKIHQAIQVLGIQNIEVPGFEADDVIGTLAKAAEQQGFETFLVTADKDFMQLVGPKTKMYRIKRFGDEAEILDEKGVEAKIGVPPSRIVDYLGLMGDSSDNIPGVPGVGAKTAVKLILEFGTVEEVLANADQVSRANVRKNLQEHRDLALLSKKLTIIDTAVPLEIDLESFKRQEPDNERVVQLFTEFEFNSLVDRFTTSAPQTKITFEVVDTEQKLIQLISELENAKSFVLNLHTTDPDPNRSEIVGIGVSARSGGASYIPVQVEKQPREQGGPSREMFFDSPGELFGRVSVSEKIRPVLENSAISKWGHNIKHLLLVLARYDISLKGADFDTMVTSYLANPTLRTYSIDSLAREQLGYLKSSKPEGTSRGKKQLSILEVPVEDVAKEQCEDVDLISRLHEKIEPELQKSELTALYQSVEMPLIEVLYDMEKTGVTLDLPFLSAMSLELESQLGQLIAKIYEMAGEEFNINSTQQLGQILFEKLQLPRKKRTKTGYSTDAKVLEELAKVHDLPQTLLEYRELVKLKSTYVDALPKLIHPETGRLHTSYNQTVAATGRLSSSDPNLQNIPIRTEMGRRIRKAFIPSAEDWVILDADYSQIELRVMAHISDDPVLKEAFEKGEDIHTKTAALVFGVDSEAVTHEHRRMAKVINFGIMYGMGVYGLASRLNISREEAQQFIADYFIQYAKVNDFMINTISEARANGFVTTMLNRRRYVPEINSPNRQRREFAERTAINTPIQGTAADLIKLAMINIWRELKNAGLRAKMIMQVHDELVFEVPKPELDQVKELVKGEMEQAIDLSVPIQVEMGVGGNWFEAH